MNSDYSTEMFQAANVSWPNTSRKHFTRDVPTTSTSYAIDIGTWTVSNGAAFFEFWIQVNTAGFTVSKYYKFSVIASATSGSWNVITPEVTSGASGSNDFELEINSSSSANQFRIHRTGGTTAGEAKIFVTKYGSTDDVFVSSTTSANVGAVAGTVYPRSYGVNYVLLSEANTFTDTQTVNARLIAKGDGSNYPAVRLGAGTANLSSNSSTDGSVLIQGTTAEGTRSQFEIISPNSAIRMAFEAHNSDGISLTPIGGHFKLNTNSGALTLGGTSSTNGLLFASGIGTGINPDGGLIRSSSGNLKVTNGSSSLANLSASKLRIGTDDTTKSQSLFISGNTAIIEQNNNSPGWAASYSGGSIVALAASRTGSFVSYDSSTTFAIIGQTNSQVRSVPGSGAQFTRIAIDTFGNVGIGMTNPTYFLDVNGSFRALTLNGNGAALTNLSASNIVGTISSGQLPFPGLSTLGGVKRNQGGTNTFVTGISTNGDLLFSSGIAQPTKTLATLKPTDWETPGSGGVATLSSRYSRPVLHFSDSVDQFAQWTTYIPEGTYLVSGLTFTAWWSSQVTVGTVGWEVSIERINDGASISTENFGTHLQIAASTVPASGLIKKTSVSFTNAQLSGVSAGEMFRTRIKRDTANDTAADIAELHMLEIRGAY